MIITHKLTERDMLISEEIVFLRYLLNSSIDSEDLSSIILKRIKYLAEKK
jgi:hypothetical protein